MTKAEIYNKPSHRFSWNGISFLMPESWNLAGYQFNKNVYSIEIEDDYALKLQLEIMNSRHSIDILKIQKQYKKKTKNLGKTAIKTTVIGYLPKAWNAFLYEFADKRSLVQAFYISDDGKIFTFFWLHFQGETKEPERILNLISSSFKTYQDGLIP